MCYLETSTSLCGGVLKACRKFSISNFGFRRKPRLERKLGFTLPGSPVLLLEPSPLTTLFPHTVTVKYRTVALGQWFSGRGGKGRACMKRS